MSPADSPTHNALEEVNAGAAGDVELGTFALSRLPPRLRKLPLTVQAKLAQGMADKAPDDKPPHQTTPRTRAWPTAAASSLPHPRAAMTRFLKRRGSSPGEVMPLPGSLA